MIRLTPDNGIPRRILLMMAVMDSFTVANLYSGWAGVCLVGGCFALATLQLSAYEQFAMKQIN